MRRILPLLLFVFLIAAQTGYAQSPPGINYQGIARNTDGKPLAQKQIAIRINIVKDGNNGSVEYSEIHSVTTNAFGLFTLVIGGGAVHTGEFENIKWEQGDKWLRVEMDPDGGSAFQLMGAQQFMSVPYAFYAKYSGNGNSGGNQSLSINTSDQLSITNGNNVSLSPYKQDLSLTGNNLSLTNDPTPATINLAPYLDNTDNQSLHLSMTGNTRTITIDNGTGVGFSIDDGDSDATNELQSLSYNTATKSLSLSGSPGAPVTINETQNLNQVLTQGTDANGQKITNLGTPTANNDAVTKMYVDNVDATINSRISTNYSFKSSYTFNTLLAVSEVTMNLTDTFDDFNVVGSTNFTAPVAGTYMFILDGSTTGLLASSAINLSYNGTKYPVAVGSNSQFNSTFMFKLTAGQTVSVVATGLGINTNIAGSFFGYKLL